MKYVTPEYEARLKNLAELLCTPERHMPQEEQLALGQLALEYPSTNE